MVRFKKKSKKPAYGNLNLKFFKRNKNHYLDGGYNRIILTHLDERGKKTEGD